MIGVETKKTHNREILYVTTKQLAYPVKNTTIVYDIGILL